MIPDGPRQISNPHLTRTESKLQNSQLAMATRRALGSNSYPTAYSPRDDHKAKHGTSKPFSSGDHQGTRHHPIPQKYLREFDRMWYEYDEDHDADQLLADLTPNGSWRAHAPLRPVSYCEGDYPTPKMHANKAQGSSSNRVSDQASRCHSHKGRS